MNSHILQAILQKITECDKMALNGATFMNTLEFLENLLFPKLI